MGATLVQLLVENVSFKRQSVNPTSVSLLQMTSSLTRTAGPAPEAGGGLRAAL